MRIYKDDCIAERGSCEIVREVNRCYNSSRLRHLVALTSVLTGDDKWYQKHHEKLGPLGEETVDPQGISLILVEPIRGEEAYENC